MDNWLSCAQSANMPAAAFTVASSVPSLTHAMAAIDLPLPKRAALGLLLRHLAHGERVAQRSALRQAGLASNTRSSRFLRSQARHEALHARIFDIAAGCLGAPPLVLPDCPYTAFDARLAAAARGGDRVATIVGTQVVLEALGEILLEHLDAGLDWHGAGLHRLRRLIRAQEAAHHAFGVAALEEIAAATQGGMNALGHHLPPYRMLAQGLIDACAPILHVFDLTTVDISRSLDAQLAQDFAR